MAGARDIAEQHEELALLRQRLAVVVEWKAGFLAGGHLRRLLAEDLEHLIRKLNRHFDLEEEGGYLRVVLEKNPNAARRVEELRSQHRAFLTEFTALRDACGGEGDLEALKRDIHDALRRLRDHEQAENDLLQRVLESDVGEGD